VLNNILKAWTSENNLFAVAAKRTVKSVMPPWLLAPIKARYYYYLMRSGAVEMEPDSEAAAKLIQPGDCVVDVGAFVGFYANFFSRIVGPTGHVLAFEPIPETYAMLVRNMQRLCPNVQCFQLALSDHAGEAFMEIPTFSKFGESCYDSRIVDRPANGLRSFRVKMAALDDIVADAHPTFLKIDAEGAEINVMRGAMCTIAKYKPAMMIETVITASSALLDILRPSGYNPFVYAEGILTPMEIHRKPQNIFFIAERPSR
jgi:FkbM family methyltransferase